MNQDTNHQEVNAAAHADTKLSLRTGLKAGSMGNIVADHPRAQTHSHRNNCLAQMDYNGRMGNNSIPAGCENVENDMSMLGP